MSETRQLAALEKALSIDETIRTKLEQLTQNGKSDAGLHKEIRESTNGLESVIDRAEAGRAEAQFDKLKDAIHRPAVRKSRF